MIDAQALHADIQALLRRLLEEADFKGAAELRAQIPHTRVLGGIPSMLDLEVEPSFPASSCPDGPFPIQGVAEDPDGTPLGFVLGWVKDGYLAALESAWVTDEPPGRLFRPEQLRVEPNSR
jgi:hypothetical protein